MNYFELLDRLHRLLRPAVYLEIGVSWGQSLALSRSRTIAIDPAAAPRPEALSGKPWLKLYQLPSDDFFDTHEKDESLEGHPLDLAFIDGLHEFAQVVRDLENVGRWSHPGTVAVVHDVLPRGAWQATRAAREFQWTGDVWRLIPFLAEHRTDLECRLVAAEPTGVLIVTRLDSGARPVGHLADDLDRDFPPDGNEYDQLVDAFVAQARPESVEAFFRTFVIPSRFVSHRLETAGWVAVPGADSLRPATDAGSALGIVLAERPRGAYRVELDLAATGWQIVRIGLQQTDSDRRWEQSIWLDFDRPGALYHEVERVALDYESNPGTVAMGIEGLLPSAAELCGLTIQTASPELRDVPPPPDVTIGVHHVRVGQTPSPRRIVRFVPDRKEARALAVIPERRPRDAVVFAWHVPADMPELGEYYVNVLRYYHPDSKLFIGMNRGSSPRWEAEIQAAGLDAVIRWADPDIEDYWDTTGFVTALEAFSEWDEAFALTWFGHTKGGSRPAFAEYEQVRFTLQRSFWACRDRIERIFREPAIGIFAPRFCPLPDMHFTGELYALERVYRGAFAPLGLHAKETFFVMRGDVVREFCRAVDTAFFRAPPGSYGASRYFFEIGFPSVASMQGYEPFIDPDVAGENHPREDAWLTFDPKQNHRLARAELERWRLDPVEFTAHPMRQLWDASSP